MCMCGGGRGGGGGGGGREEMRVDYLYSENS
jgi:hypothetical protein